jgi:hypothetical protein
VHESKKLPWHFTDKLQKLVIKGFTGEEMESKTTNSCDILKAVKFQKKKKKIGESTDLI